MVRAKSRKAASKATLRDELATILGDHLETMRRSHRDASEGATHEEARAEDDKDTRALEQSYLARGQAFRADQLQKELEAVQGMPTRAFEPSERIDLGALVTLEDEDREGETLTVYLVPAGGGNKLGKGGIQTATPRSPLGESLMGRAQGDTVEITRGGRVSEVTVIRVE